MLLFRRELRYRVHGAGKNRRNESPLGVGEPWFQLQGKRMHAGGRPDRVHQAWADVAESRTRGWVPVTSDEAWSTLCILMMMKDGLKGRCVQQKQGEERLS
jgi:hypothetical protein